MVFFVESANRVFASAAASRTYHREKKIFFRVMGPAHKPCERLRDLRHSAVVQRCSFLEFFDNVSHSYNCILDQVMLFAQYSRGGFDVLHRCIHYNPFNSESMLVRFLESHRTNLYVAGFRWPGSPSIVPSGFWKKSLIACFITWPFTTEIDAVSGIPFGQIWTQFCAYAHS